MKRLAAAVAALVLSAGSPALALAQSPAVAENPLVQMQDYLQRLAAWSQPLQQSLHAQTTAFLQMLEGADVALDYYDRKAKRDGRTWAKLWAAEQEQTWAAIGTELEAAATTPPPTPPAGAMGDPAFARMVRGVNDVPSTIRRDFERNRALTQSVVPKIQAVASGDKRAAESLAAEVAGVSIAIVEAENDLATASMPLTTPDHPHWHLLAATKSANLGLIGLLGAEKSALLSEAIDEPALAARLRQHADAVEAAAEGVRTKGRDLIAQLRARPELAGTELLATAERALATYQDSADVEQSIAAVLRDIATRIDEPGDVDWQEILPPLDQLETLSAKRVAIDAQRRSSIQGS